MKLPGQGRPGRAAAIVVTVAALLVLAPSAFATTEVLGKVDGLKYVRASDTVAATNLSAASATVHANCGVSPWKTTGGGAAIDGAAGSSYLTQSEDYVKRWYGIGWHYAQPAKPLRVFGICSKSSAISHDTHVASFATAPPPSV